ncbi:MAG: MFS transporter [Bacteroidales bacterium]|jgi:PAT family beta-lactamase induction signal transducer AmpG|nr:MFS transporter [Bacteroidales bacterium]
MSRKEISPWRWTPSLYFAEGLPYVVVITVSIILFKRLGLSNTDVAFYTSWLNLPWVIKPFWSPFVDLLKTKRWWIVSMQLMLGAGVAGVAFAISSPFYVQASLAFFWLIAFSSATHDIAADGFYLLGLNPAQQSFFIGIRTTCYRLAMISGQGALIVLAGALEVFTGNVRYAWCIAFFVLAGIFVLLFVYHRVALPYPERDKPSNVCKTDMLREFCGVFIAFFRKEGIGIALAFMLFYRLSESLLVKMAVPFLLDSREAGGMGMTTGQVGLAYGTVGAIALIAGGILGGVTVSRYGLKRWLWPMALSTTLPNIVYVYLSCSLTAHLVVVHAAVAVEQFGFGFGITAYMLYLMHFSEGKYKTAHYAIATGVMALSIMLPGMIAGWLQELLGYKHFFIWVMICIIPACVVIPFVKLRLNS